MVFMTESRSESSVQLYIYGGVYKNMDTTKTYRSVDIIESSFVSNPGGYALLHVSSIRWTEMSEMAVYSSNTPNYML